MLDVDACCFSRRATAARHLQQPDFWKRLDQAPSGEPSARGKPRQAKTRLRAAYDMVPNRASIEISLNEILQYPENAHQKVRFRPTGWFCGAFR
jgi:hypothetical protein